MVPVEEKVGILEMIEGEEDSLRTPAEFLTLCLGKVGAHDNSCPATQNKSVRQFGREISQCASPPICQFFETVRLVLMRPGDLVSVPC